jgi:hypothetical protein
VRIVTYTGKQQANFYIQNKGDNAGRPLRAPIRNCFAVFSDDEFLFQKVQVLFIARYFERFIHGSVIPTIRLNDVKDVIEQNYVRQDEKAMKQLDALEQIDKVILISQQKIKTLKEYKTALAYELTKRKA